MELRELTNEIVESSDSSYLIDFQGKGELLVIAFGFYHPEIGCQFDFYKRLKKLEVMTGRKINKLLLRDKSQLWYLNNVDETLEIINRAVKEISPSRIITIGQSMGAYAAMLFAALAPNVEKAIAYGPLSTFNSKLLDKMADQRWGAVVNEVEKLSPKPEYTDLPPLVKNSRTNFEVYYGTKPEDEGRDGVNKDVAHAMRFGHLHNVKLYPLHQSAHAVVEYLRVNKVIDALLRNSLFGDAIEFEKDEFVSWAILNLQNGCTEEQLYQETAKSGVDKAVVESAINKAKARMGAEQALKA